MVRILTFLLLFFLPLISSAQDPFAVSTDSNARHEAIEKLENENPPINGTSEQAIEFYRKKFTDPEEAWYESLADRNRIDPRNIPLRDAEHYWWARFQVEKAKWWAKPYKFLQQTICTLGYSTYKMLKEPITGNTTPPSFREIKYGLKGAWEGLFPPGKPE
ncbi:MAG: hypothetical protein ACOYXC_02620 [Candidatus Rifleibacteriota bacterium]